ncbi:MAG TPA: alpha/beta fold hydrolase [Solirubrobacteraceae bacterium]|jgi:2-succinyl-6-hydroxy-2,4-cyclohexadiene-1-carboxylate synthase
MAPELVLLHGFTHSGASWGRVVTALRQRYRPLAPDIRAPDIRAPDIRGHASAAGRTPVSLDAVIEDVAALTPARFDLAGYSMGGRIALHVALALPERVGRLTLIGASPGLADPAERAHRRAADERLAAEIEASSLEAFAARWAHTPVLAGLPADVAAEVHADRLRSTPAGLARALRGLGTGALPPLWDRLGELAAPVTVIVGERDEKFRALGTEMAALIPDVRLEVVAGTGHAVHLEAPERAAELIAASLALY